LQKNKSALFIIFLTIFIDLLGFGIIIPLLPSFSQNVLHLTPFTIGLIAGIFSLMQFIFTPVWGHLSDRYGRKPILIMSLTGSVISYIILAQVFSGALLSPLALILARAFAGIFAANISAAQAVISDTTTAEDRTRGMGLIGAAFALGFVFGPAIGGFLAKYFGYAVPIYVSAFLSLAALILCITVFKETLSPEIREKNRLKKDRIRIMDFKQLYLTVKKPEMGSYIIISFFLIFSFSNIFGTFQLYAERSDGLNLQEDEIGFLFSFLGIFGAIVQSFVLKMFRNKFGDERTLVIGNFFGIFGLGLIAFSFNIPFLLFVLTILALGNGLYTPTTLSLISQNAPHDEQGKILGINQSLGSLARFFGPLWGGFVYQNFGYKFPFITGGVFMILITIYSYKVMKDRERKK
jgi:DHA1 family tetracycline resistance protein-like MFS transporter